MSKSYILLVAAFAATLTSCFKDEPLGNECDIEAAYIHADNPGELFLQPTDSIVNVTSVQQKVNLSVIKGTDLTHVAPQFYITAGATISPASGSAHDFSQGPVVYTVTSEDGAYKREYAVSVGYYPVTVANFDFEGCSLYENTNGKKWYVWNDYDASEDPNWASGNAGFSIARGSAKPEEYPTAPLAEGYEGKGVQLRTCDTGGFGQMVNMRIAAGNLFTGVFDAKKATSSPMAATHFGEGAKNKIYKRPLRFSGYYQYTPGETFQDKLGNPVAGRVDQGDIYAVVYKNTDDHGDAFYLTGDNVLTSQQIVLLARVPNVVKTENGWNFFDIPFDAKGTLDPATLASGGYNMAVVFTSSIEGAVFEGAIGSTLLIDKVRIVYDDKDDKDDK